MCQLSLDHIFPQDLRRPYDSRRWAMRWVITRPSAVVAEVCNGRWPCNFFRRWRSWRWRLVCVVMGSYRFIDATHRWQPWCYCRCRKRGKPQICLELCWVKLLSGLENVWRGRTEFDSLYSGDFIRNVTLKFPLAENSIHVPQRFWVNHAE